MFKKFVYVFLFFVSISLLLQNLFADNEEGNNKLPVTICVDVYPDKIQYGDVCFARFFATNQSKKTVYCLFGGVSDYIATELCFGEELLQIFYPYLYDTHDGFCQHAAGRGMSVSPRKLLQHNEPMMFQVRATWLPVPELTRSVFSEYNDYPLPAGMVLDKFNAFIEQKKSTFDLKFFFDGFDFLTFFDLDKNVKNEFSDHIVNRFISKREIFTKEQLTAKGYKLSAETSPVIKWQAWYGVQSKICIVPRSKATLNLIHQWYFEIPSTVNPYGEWTSHGLFVHPHHAKGSPHILKLNENENENFIALMRTRTPELLSRVKRTKELEAELLKLPDSELSQNMKEFIKLRGYLVDIRFADNETAENKAFDDLVKFVDKSKDKELWIQFVEEVAFDSIFDAEHFPHKKVQNYRKRFAEKFTPQNK